MDKKKSVTKRSTKRRRKSNDLPAFPTLDAWLRKEISAPEVKPKTKSTSNLSPKSSIETCELNSVNHVCKKARQSPTNQTKFDGLLSRRTRHFKRQSPVDQTRLDSFVKTRNSTKQKLTRSESSDSCDLPIFKKARSSSKMIKKSNSKYGNILPTVEEILKDQRDLEKYRQQLETFQPLADSTLELPFPIKDLEQMVESPVENLDCKQVSDQELTELFNSNLDYLSAIMLGKIKHSRHKKFYSVKRRRLPVTENLTYNTSMIVFSYNQIEQLLTLLKSHFDPDNTKTHYFFQVLLPELCLQIFMKTHKMNRSEALRYLDKRPILPED